MSPVLSLIPFFHLLSVSAVKPSAAPPGAPAVEPGAGKGARSEQRVIGGFFELPAEGGGNGAGGHLLNMVVQD